MTSIDLATLLKSLPACKRCRKNRRRCDTLLPSCVNCSKAGVECIFYDHALQEELPRSYIASLVEHLERDASITTTTTVTESPITQLPPIASSNTPQEHHFAYAQGAYRYLGAGSHLLDVQVKPQHRSQIRQPPRQCPPLPSSSSESISTDLRAYLTQLFFDTIQQVYPILDPSSPWLWGFDNEDNNDNESSTSPTRAFVQEMVCAVACHCAQDPSLHRLAPAAHARALLYIEQATAAQAVSTLQVVVLLVLYTLVCPATGGNLSQQLGFAIRLVIDLCEGGDTNSSDDTNEQQPERYPPLLSLYKVIYCLENHVCGVLVRPTALPEPADPLIMPSFSSFRSLSTPSNNSSLDLLCTLYRVQARFRHGRLDEKDVLRDSVPAFAEAYRRHQEQQERAEDAKDTICSIHPNVAAVLSETCLVLDPVSINAAVALLDACSDLAFLATFASAYWVQRAGNVVVDALLRGKVGDMKKKEETTSIHSQLLRAYGQAVSQLQAWAGTWDAAGVLRQALEQRLEGGQCPVALGHANVCP